MTDFRRHNLMILGGLTLLSVVLAAGAVYFRAQQTKAQFTPTEFLPGFADHVKDAARIHVVSQGGAFDVVYRPDKGSWVLPARGNYPADFPQVRHSLIGLAALEAVEPKTARADWLSYVGLQTPPKGNGVAFTVSDLAGHVLTSVITGSTGTLDNAQGATGLFVRHPGDNQTYLARSVFTPQGDVAAWEEADVMSIEAARPQTITITPIGGAPYTVAREHTSDPGYTLQGPMPKGMTGNGTQVNLIPQLITDFKFADVRPASEVDFSKAGHFTAHTFDQQNIRFDAAAANGGIWIKVSAEPDASTPTMQKQEAAKINAHAAGWAYKLSPERARFFTMKREDLLTKAAEAEPGPQGLPPGMTFGAPN